LERVGEEVTRRRRWPSPEKSTRHQGVITAKEKEVKPKAIGRGGKREGKKEKTVKKRKERGRVASGWNRQKRKRVLPGPSLRQDRGRKTLSDYL